MYSRVKMGLIFMFGEEGKSPYWLHKSCLAELVGFEVTDYLLPSGTKCSESLGRKNIARRCCVTQLGSKTASLLDHSAWVRMGSRWKGGLSRAPERLCMDMTSRVASSARPSVPWIWGDARKSNRDWKQNLNHCHVSKARSDLCQ